jgi:hypothetical protein
MTSSDQQHSLRRMALRAGTVGTMGLALLLGSATTGFASPSSPTPSSYPVGASETVTLSVQNNNAQQINALAGTWTGNGTTSPNPVSCAPASIAPKGSTTCTLTFTANPGANALLITVTGTAACGAPLRASYDFSYIGVPADGAVAPQLTLR